MAYHPFRHLGLKFLSVAMALGLWFTRGRRADGRAQPARAARASQPPAEARAGRGPAVDGRGAGARRGRACSASCPPGDVVAEVDLALARTGRRYFHLTPAQVRAPFGVDVVDVTPGTISLRFETSLSRRVPVVPMLDGEPAPGLRRRRGERRPDDGRSRGPRERGPAPQGGHTEPVSIAGAQRSRCASRSRSGCRTPACAWPRPATLSVTVQIDPMPVRLVDAGSRAHPECRPRRVGRRRCPPPSPSPCAGRRTWSRPCVPTRSPAYRRPCRPRTGPVQSYGSGRAVRRTSWWSGPSPPPCT